MDLQVIGNKMTSMQIAEVTGKQHKHVLRDIADEIEKLENAGISAEPKFGLRERDGLTGKIPYYELTKEGVLQIAARYDAAIRAKLIELATKNDASPARIDSKFLFAIAAQLEEKEQQIALMKPKADFFDAVADSKTAIEMSKAAKVLNFGKGRTTLFAILREEGLLRYNNEPYQEYIDRGYFRTIEQKYTKPDGSTYVSIKTLVYQKGLDYIRKILDRRKGVS